MTVSGGYDEGYEACNLFWGTKPGSLVQWAIENTTHSAPGIVLDIGCGEGKNAIAFARLGYKVVATDISEKAMSNGKERWKESEIDWIHADARDLDFESGQFDVVVSYGLIHCFSSFEEAESVVERCKSWTKVGGLNIVCAFNNRDHDLSAHPNFQPLLIPHDDIVSMYTNWEVLRKSDETLYETHPHNNIPHHHSLTRLVARKLEPC